METINATSTYNYSSSRYGFNHTGILYLNGEEVQRATIHYTNRTWECYCGQTARKSACADWLKEYEDATKDEVKARLGVSRATKKVKDIVATELANDAKYNAVKAHYESL